MSRAFPNPISNTTNLAFVVPFYSSPTFSTPSYLFSQEASTVSYFTVKDISGLAGVSNIQINRGVPDQYANLSDSLAETSGFFNYLTFTNQTVTLQATNVSSFTANTIYNSTTYIDGTPESFISSQTIRVRTYIQPSTITESTIPFNTFVSTLELSTTGYLYFSSQNLYLNTSTINPIVSFNPTIQTIRPNPWTPASIPNLQTWFDAKDLSTMYADDSYSRTISSGESFAVWLDKSPNQFSCIQTTTSNQPLFLNGQVYFNSTTYMSTNYKTYSTCIHTFVAPSKFNTDTEAGGGYQFQYAANWIEATASGTNLAIGLIFYSQRNAWVMQSPFYSINVPGEPNYSPPTYTMFFDLANRTTTTSLPSTPNIYTILYDKQTSNIVRDRQNGVDYNQRAADPIILDYRFWHLGDVNEGGGPTGYWGDILVYDRWLTETELQQLESYLAYKYNIQGKLQATSAYFNRSP